MITEKMTPDEIEKDLTEDLKVVDGFIKQLAIKLRRNAIKTNMKFPYRSVHNYTSKRKNQWVVQIEVESKSKAKEGEIGLITACLYDTNCGKYAAVKTTDSEMKFLIFPPHFFKRYRERKHLDSSIPTQNLILKFFNENPGNITYYEPDSEPDRNIKVITKEGMLFGMLLSPRTALIKTFVGDEQFFDNQKKLRDELNEINGLNKLLDGTNLMRRSEN